MDILAIINQEVKEIFSDIVLDTSPPSEDLEREVLEATRELGRKVLEWCLSESANETSSVSITCPVCEEKLRRFRKRQRYVQTLCGVVSVSRWVYRCDACDGLSCAVGFTSQFEGWFSRYRLAKRCVVSLRGWTLEKPQRS